LCLTELLGRRRQKEAKGNILRGLDRAAPGALLDEPAAPPGANLQRRSREKSSTGRRRRSAARAFR
jgi:hypothetical protein